MFGKNSASHVEKLSIAEDRRTKSRPPYVFKKQRAKGHTRRFFLLLGLLLGACTSSVEATGGEEASLNAAGSTSASGLSAQLEKPEQAVSAGEKEAPSPTMTGFDCLARGGQVEVFELESELLAGGLRFRVYTPPCYAEQPQRSFPVLYLIHGQTYSDNQWVRLGVGETADELFRAGELSPFLIVMPFDKSSAQPSVDKFGEAVMQELLPWIEENYRTRAAREYRAIGGLSRGASWALHLGLRYPEVFGAIGGHSPPVFVEDAGKVRGWLAEIPVEYMPRIWLDIGERDQQAILSSATWFASVLDELDIPHEWHLFSGYHDEHYWSSHVESYLRWYAALW